MFRLDLDTPELAEAYGRAAPLLFMPGKRLVQALHLSPFDQVLDVGCGTGLLSDYASRLVPEGLVVGIDPLPRRVAIARRRKRSNLRFQTGSALDLSSFAADSFDAAFMHLVFHWLSDKVEPLRQLHRVMKPGARLGLTTTAGECKNTLETVCGDVFSRPPYAAYTEAWDARLRHVSSAELARLLDETGFDVERLEVEPTLAEWPSAGEAIAFSETIAAGNLIGHLPEQLREPAREELAKALERLRHAGVIRIQGARIFAVAVRRESGMSRHGCARHADIRGGSHEARSNGRHGGGERNGW